MAKVRGGGGTNNYSTIQQLRSQIQDLQRRLVAATAAHPMGLDQNDSPLYPIFSPMFDAQGRPIW